jgi:ABC-type multidrug transport system fused ATPase/permease subunit
VALIQLLLMLVGMLFETIGIGLLVPVLTVISEKNIGEAYPKLNPLLNTLGNPTHSQLVIWIMSLLVVIYFLKMLFLSLLAWRQSKFVYGLQANFSQKLFEGYLFQPYAFHLNRNSATLIRNTTVLISIMTSSLTAFMTILTEVCIFLGIFVFLLYFEPVGTLLVGGLFAVTFLLFNIITKKKLLQWGNSYQIHEGKRIMHLQQGLGGVKDVKLLGRENNFLKSYYHSNYESAKAGQYKESLAALPRLWMEIIVVVCMAVLLIILAIQGKGFSMILPILGVFAASAFRLMPSVNRIMQAFQNMRYAQPAIDGLYEELSVFQKEPYSGATKDFMPFENTIKVTQISFKYETAKTPALQHVNISIPKGSTIGIIGTSGAGKSTLVDIILGLLQPDDGSIQIDNRSIADNLRGWQDHIGYVSQSIFLTDDTLRKNIAFGIADNEIDEHRVQRALELSQLSDFVSQLPEGLETIVGERGVRLSGGQRQRIGIARALYHDPLVLVLDEATSSLDTNTEAGVMDAVQQMHGNKTIIIVAHRLSTVEHCDYVYRLEHGRIVEEGKTSDVLKNAQIKVKA